MAAVFHLKPSSKIPSSIRNVLRHSTLRFKPTESKTSRKTSRLDGLRRKLKEENDGSVPLVTFTMPESDTESDTDSVQCDEEVSDDDTSTEILRALNPNPFPFLHSPTPST